MIKDFGSSLVWILRIVPHHDMELGAYIGEIGEAQSTPMTPIVAAVPMHRPEWKQQHLVEVVGGPLAGVILVRPATHSSGTVLGPETGKGACSPQLPPPLRKHSSGTAPEAHSLRDPQPPRSRSRSPRRPARSITEQRLRHRLLQERWKVIEQCYGCGGIFDCWRAKCGTPYCAQCWLNFEEGVNADDDSLVARFGVAMRL